MGIAQITGHIFKPRSYRFSVGRVFDALFMECAAQKASFFLWSPVFVAFGIGGYFSLPVEPPLVFGIFSFVFSLVVLMVLWSRLRVPAILFVLVVAGFLSAQLRTHFVHTPILQKSLGPVKVVGVIDAIEDLGDGAGARLILSGLEIERLSVRDTPKKVRLKIWKDEGLRVGQRIEVLAKMRKPSAPVIPGGFDFQRHLYFKKIGAVGFTFTAGKVLEDVPAYTFDRFIERTRQRISQSIEANMVYPWAPVAMALITGRKTAIEKADNEAMRHAGLAHMLAISGLHVGLFSGVVFFFARLFMVLIPGLALRRPIKKYAAVIAIFAAFSYMCLAGATIPTQRALLMTSVVFLAIILDRSPLSLRLVAFAALVVLLIFPESLLSASFHMSFGAVTGLILFYEWARPFLTSWHRQAGFLRRAGLYFAGVCMTTVVATIATAPFALFHFNQLAVYSLIANIIAMPLLAFIVMPSVVVALFLMPFGLEGLAFYPMDIGIYGVLEVAHFVSALPHAVFIAPAWPLVSLVGLVLGGLVLALWHGRLRYLSLVGFIIFGVSLFHFEQPDILISSNYDLVAYKAEDGSFHVSNTRKGKFVRENWARSYGLGAGEALKWLKEGSDDYMTCGEQGCRFSLKGYNVSYITQPIVGMEECAGVDLILSKEPFEGCEVNSVIDFFDVYYGGAHAVWLTEDGLVIKRSEVLRGRRPWSALNAEF